MYFLLIPPVFLVLAQLWLTWKSRTRRAPEIEETIEAHQRFRAAMASGNVKTVDTRESVSR